MRVESRLPDASPNKSTALICAGLVQDHLRDNYCLRPNSVNQQFKGVRLDLVDVEL